MVKHIIIWTLKDTFSSEEKKNIKLAAKENLEALVGKIDGLIDLKVQITTAKIANIVIMVIKSISLPKL